MKGLVLVTLLAALQAGQQQPGQDRTPPGRGGQDPAGRDPAGQTNRDPQNLGGRPDLSQTAVQMPQDGQYTLVYAERDGRKIEATGNVTLQSNTLTLNMDGKQQWIRFQFLPNNRLMVMGMSEGLGTGGTGSGQQRPGATTRPGGAAQPGQDRNPSGQADRDRTQAGQDRDRTGASGQAGAADPKGSGGQGILPPNSGQGVYITSQEFLCFCLSVNQAQGQGGTGARPGSPADPQGNATNPANPQGATGQPGRPSAGGAGAAGGNLLPSGNNKDQFVLVLRKGTGPAANTQERP